MIVMCHCRFINCKKCTTLLVILIMGEVMHVCVRAYKGNLCTFPLTLLRTLDSKKLSFIKKKKKTDTKEKNTLYHHRFLLILLSVLFMGDMILGSEAGILRS